MAALMPLDPAPVVVCHPVELVALEAGRAASGLAATVQAVNGTVKAAKLVRLADPDDRVAFAREVAAACDVDAQDVASALLELLPAVEAALRQAQGGRRRGASVSQDVPYLETPNGLVWLKPTPNGPTPTQLTNFTAKIVADVALDDGAEVRHVYEVEAGLNDKAVRFQVPAAQFAGMSWVSEHLGAGAIVYPGFALKDHSRAAIQMLSGQMATRRVFSHSGWRRVDGQDVYLHAGGALGAQGPLPHIEVVLRGVLARLSLPEPPQGQGLVEAVRASLALLDLAPDRIMVPVLGSVYRAPLCEVAPADLAVYLVGHTGAFKSELAARAQQHFGAGFDRLHLPASWAATANFLERLAFEAKDAVLTVDDFAPTGSGVDIARLHATADRLVRGVGNRAARGRMSADGRLRPDFPPRGLVLVTGEDTPRGHSLRGRMLILEIAQGDVDLVQLTRAQSLGRQGVYAAAMAAFVAYLAARLDELRCAIPERIAGLRERAHGEQTHRRTPDAIANMAVAWQTWLDFAVQVGAIDAGARDAVWRRIWRALGEVAAAQAGFLEDQDVSRSFLSLVRAALASGSAHLCSREGGRPDQPGAWGWQQTAGVGEWRPLGSCIGWLDDDDVYLEPQAAYVCAQRLARDGGGTLPVTLLTLKKRLNEHGFLATVDKRGSKTHLEVRRVVGGQRRELLHLKAGTFIGEEVPHVPHVPTAEQDSEPASVPSGPNGAHGARVSTDKVSAMDEAVLEPSGGRSNGEMVCSNASEGWEEFEL